MATYAIGDVQGCYEPLQRLLAHIHFDPLNDQLWFTGDLVNRGPQSLEVLRFVTTLPKSPIVVLGNHDLHLLAVAYNVAPEKNKDTLNNILHDSQCEFFCNWLRQQPLLYHDEKLGYTMTHAGLAPQWTLDEAKALAKEVENILRSEHYVELLQNIYGNEPARWDPHLTGWARYRVITNYLTRMRFCKLDGTLDLSYKGEIGSQPPELVPWFEVPNRANSNLSLIFGHWSALQGQANTADIYPLDTGCIWGNQLTALRLEDKKRFFVPCLSISHR